jgi:hypothetical protein
VRTLGSGLNEKAVTPDVASNCPNATAAVVVFGGNQRGRLSGGIMMVR